MLAAGTRLRIARGARRRWEREATLRLGFGSVALTGDPERGHRRLAEAFALLARTHELATLVARREREAAGDPDDCRFSTSVIRLPEP